MSKLYVPDGAWLVCSKGMKKQQIAVTSHNKVFIAGNHLKATIEDRPGGNFVCGRMAIAGAIIGAVVGVVFVVGTVATGGALAIGAGATMAACAAGGAAAGGLASLTPSICGMLLHKWQPYDTNVLTANIPPLLENSQIPCRLGGTVIILYSKKAADEMTDVIIGDTAVGVIGTIAFAYIMGPAMSAIAKAGATAFATYQEFGGTALTNYLLGVGTTGTVAYISNELVNKGKNYGYSKIPIPGTDRYYGDYVNGFDTDVVKLQEAGLQKNPSNQSKSMDNLGNDIGSATDIGSKTVGDRTSQVVKHDSSIFARLDDIEENGPTITNQSGKIDGAIVGKTQTKTNHIEVTNQDYGGRYQEGNRHTITSNSQYDPIKRDLKTAETLGKNAVNNYINDQKGWTKFNKEGPQGGGLYFGLLQDLAKAISNFLLEGQAKDVLEAMKKEEAEARAKINVIAGKD